MRRRSSKQWHSYAITLLFLSLISGCGTTIEIDEPPPPVVCNREPVVDVINLDDTPPTAVLRDPFILDEEGKPVAVNPNAEWGWWFDSNLYAGLAENLQQMRKNATQLRAVARYYRACIEDHNANLVQE